MDDRVPGEQGWRCRPKTRSVLGRHPEVRRDLELARSLGLTLHQFDRLSQSEREFWIADWEIERSKCHQCGGDRKECGDPEKAWYPQRTVCYASMANAWANAEYDRLHPSDGAHFHDGTFKSWANVRSKSHPFEAREGVTIWVSGTDLDPDGDFLSGGSFAAQESPGEQDQPAD